MPRKGEVVDTKTITSATPAKARVLSQFEAAQALAARGMAMNRELAALLRREWPEGVPEDELDALHARLTVRGGLRVVVGGGAA